MVREWIKIMEALKMNRMRKDLGLVETDALPLGFYSSKSKRALVEQGLIEKVEGGYKLTKDGLR